MQESVSSQRHTKRAAQPDDVRLVQRQQRRLDRDRRGKPERQRPRASRRRMPASHRETDFRRADRSGSGRCRRAPCRPPTSRAGRCCGPGCRHPRPACRTPGALPRIAQWVAGYTSRMSIWSDTSGRTRPAYGGARAAAAGGRELIAFPGKAGAHINRRDRRYGGTRAARPAAVSSAAVSVVRAPRREGPRYRGRTKTAPLCLESSRIHRAGRIARITGGAARRWYVGESCIWSPSASSSVTGIACSITTASASIRTGTTRSPRWRCGPTGSTAATWLRTSATSSASSKGGSIASSITR